MIVQVFFFHITVSNERGKGERKKERERTTLTHIACPFSKSLPGKFSWRSKYKSKLQNIFQMMIVCNLKLFSFVSHMFTLSSIYVNWNENWQIHTKNERKKERKRSREWQKLWELSFVFGVKRKQNKLFLFLALKMTECERKKTQQIVFNNNIIIIYLENCYSTLWRRTHMKMIN